MAQDDQNSVPVVKVIEPPEPPEQWACRSRTPAEELAIAARQKLLTRMACHVCGEHHIRF